MSRPEWIEVGRISRPHGVHGEVRVLPSSDNPERFVAGSVLHARPERLGVAGGRERERIQLTIKSMRGQDSFPIVGFQEIINRDDAEALRGCVLEVHASQLPQLDEDEFYPFELIGLEVRDMSGASVGEVTEVAESPAHSLLIVKKRRRNHGEPAEILVPFVRVAVPTVAVAEGYLVISPGFAEGSEGEQDDDEGSARGRR